MTVCVFDFNTKYMLADGSVMEGMVFCEPVFKIRQAKIKGNIYTFAIMGETSRANFLVDLIKAEAASPMSPEERLDRNSAFKALVGESFAAVLCSVYDPDTNRLELYEYNDTTFPVRILAGDDNLAIIANAGVKLALRSAMASGATLDEAYRAVSQFDASLRMDGDNWYAERVFTKVLERDY